MMNSKTSFTGKSAIDTINDPNSSDKAKENANRHLRELEKITGKLSPSVSDARDKAAVRDSSGGIGPSTDIGSQNIGIEDVDVTSLSDQSKGYSNAATGIGNTSSTGAVGSGGGLGEQSSGEGDNPGADQSTTDSSAGMDFNIGGLAGKKKPKPKTKKMKRGGLASR